jgi:prolyl-tRNA editing enzyme YbaK/EbsC (Cys-tRNA(Pro) deacylase)
VWPDPVERIAAFIRSSGAEGQIEELPVGADEPPGPALRASGFECDGKAVVVLAPTDRILDVDKVSTAAGCARLNRGKAGSFPFQDARVLLDSSTLLQPLLWLQAGSPRHVLGLVPSELVRLTQARSADLLLAGEVHDGGPG